MHNSKRRWLKKYTFDFFLSVTVLDFGRLCYKKVSLFIITFCQQPRSITTLPYSALLHLKITLTFLLYLFTTTLWLAVLLIFIQVINSTKFCYVSFFWLSYCEYYFLKCTKCHSWFRAKTFSISVHANYFFSSSFRIDILYFAFSTFNSIFWDPFGWLQNFRQKQVNQFSIGIYWRTQLSTFPNTIFSTTISI